MSHRCNECLWRSMWSVGHSWFLGPYLNKSSIRFQLLQPGPHVLQKCGCYGKVRLQLLYILVRREGGMFGCFSPAPFPSRWLCWESRFVVAITSHAYLVRELLNAKASCQHDAGVLHSHHWFTNCSIWQSLKFSQPFGCFVWISYEGWTFWNTLVALW